MQKTRPLSLKVEQLYRKNPPYIVSLPDDATFVWQKESWLKQLQQLFFKLCITLKHYAALEVAQGVLFLFIPVFMSAGAIVYFYLKEEPDFLRLLAWMSLNAAFLYFLRNYYFLRYVFWFLLCVFFGVFFAQLETIRVNTTMLGSNVSTTLTGRIKSLEKLEDGRTRLMLDVLKTESPHLYYAPQHIRVTARAVPDDLKPGDGLYGKVLLFAASGATRPGSYDFSYHNYYKSIGAQGFFMGKAFALNVLPPESFFDRLELEIALLRHAMTQKIRQALSGEVAFVAAALITGQRGGISNATNDALRLSGLAHILSISGLHMAMVTGMVLMVVRLFLAFFQNFSSLYPSKKIAAVIALFVSAFYLLLSGADVAAQRSFIMVAVMLFAVLCDRSSITLRNLAIAAILNIIIVPHEILGPSFQMSFSATAALVAAFAWWSKRRKILNAGKENNGQEISARFVGGHFLIRIFTPFGSTAMASLIAGGASGIFAAYHFANVAPFGVISNALAFPVMSFLVMPFAVLATVFMPFGLEWFPLQIMGFGIYLVEKIAYFVAGISPNIAVQLIPASALVFITLGLVFLMFFKTKLRLFSVVFFLIGIFLCLMSTKPMILISEDVKMVGVIDENQLFLQRKKPIKFTNAIWQSSYNLTSFTAPAKLGEQKIAQFGCNEILCLAKTPQGSIVSVILGDEEMTKNCQENDVFSLSDYIIIASPFDFSSCLKDHQKVITKQELALKGSLAIMQNGELIFASDGPKRAWNSHRQYSRPARGLE